MFAAITAITVYIYKPDFPKSFKKIKILVKLISKKINQVIIIGIELNIVTNPSKLKVIN